MAAQGSFTSIILSGLFTTLMLSLISLLIAVIPGTILYLGRISKNGIVKALCSAYIHLFDGIPLLVQIAFIYYALPLISRALTFPALATGIIILSLNAVADMAVLMESFKRNRNIGSQESQDIFIVFKLQALAALKEFAELIKYSTLLSIIAIKELYRAANVASNSMGTVTPIVTAVIIYLVLNIAIKSLTKMLDKSFFKEK